MPVSYFVTRLTRDVVLSGMPLGLGAEKFSKHNVAIPSAEKSLPCREVLMPIFEIDFQILSPSSSVNMLKILVFFLSQTVLQALEIMDKMLFLSLLAQREACKSGCVSHPSERGAR